jgi:hypothetical protein
VRGSSPPKRHNALGATLTLPVSLSLAKERRPLYVPSV